MGINSLGPPYLWPSVSQPEADDNEKTELLSLSWNQKYDRFAAGTGNGFQIYDCKSCKEIMRRNLQSGDFGIVEMFRDNILALVGGGANPQYPPNKVLIWDDQRSCCTNELAFRSNVRSVKMIQDCIVVVLEHKIYIYNFAYMQLLNQIETTSNPKGLCCLSHHSNTSVLACPGEEKGQVRVEHFGVKTKLINAHVSQIACITLTHDGLLLATASTKGTLVRIFNTKDGSPLQEVRRGLDRAEIYSISLSPNKQWLAVSSDKGTIHVFSVRVSVAGEDVSTEATNQGSGMVCQHARANASSSLSFIKGFLPKVFSSERSFAQFHMPEVTRYIAAFGAEDDVMIIGIDGSFYRCTFDPVNGGQMLQKEFVRFLNADGLRS